MTSTSIAAGQEPARSPAGQFQCRNWDIQPTTLLAVLVLRSDGSYDATDRLDDLNAHRPTTTGRYSYDKTTQALDWTSGGWKDRIGIYMPQVKGTDFVVIHMKNDPEGRVHGALRCARTP